MKKKSSKNSLLVNFSSLSFVQIVNYLFPLLLIPYIVRIIGPAKYGAFAFATAVAGYFAMLADWGISLYAPREIAIHREEPQELSHLLSSIIYLRALSVLFLSLAFIAAVMLVGKFRQEKTLFLLSTLYILMAGFGINWFFQGVERMTHIAFSQLMTKILWAALILSFIRKEQDYLILPLIYFISDLVGKIYLFSLMFKKWRITLSLPSFHRMKEIVKASFPLFVSNISIKIYTGINTVFLGFLTNSEVVGYYSLAEKIIKALLGVQSQISVVFYPHISSRIKTSLEKAARSVKQGATAVMLMAIPLFLLSFTFAKEIILLVGGEKFLPSITTFRVLSFLFIIVGLSNVLGLQILLPMGRRKEFMNATLWSILVIVLLDILLIPPMKQYGAALSFVFSEVAVMLIMFYHYIKMGIGFLEWKRLVKLLTLALIMGLALMAMEAMGFQLLVELAVFLVLYVILIEVLGLINIKKKTIMA